MKNFILRWWPYVTIAIAAVFGFVGLSAVGASAHMLRLMSYTPPTDLVPADVSSDNLVSIFSQIISNGAVLTVLLAALAVGLFGAVWRAIKKARSA